MKFSEKYPHMKPIGDEEDGMIRGRRAEPCFVCGCPTEYVEICSEAHFCSDECLNEFYTEFCRSLNTIPDVEDDEL